MHLRVNYTNTLYHTLLCLYCQPDNVFYQKLHDIAPLYTTVLGGHDITYIS